MEQLSQHWLPKLNENLIDIGRDRIEHSIVKREGRYTTVILVGRSAFNVGEGIAHRSLDDHDNPGLGVRIAWDRAVHDYLRNDGIVYTPVGA